VIDLTADLHGTLPDHVVGVPMYVLGGRIVSLGNPYPDELFARLRETIG
jgi:hypothetical protein